MFIISDPEASSSTDKFKFKIRVRLTPIRQEGVLDLAAELHSMLCALPGVDVMIFKVFSPKNLAKILAFFT
jgi:hypothetical protein